jgi:hypothetical protein
LSQSYILVAKPTIIPEKSLTDTVDLGITYKLDAFIRPLRATFIINNDSDKRLRITDQDQTSAIFAIDGGIDQTFRQFIDDYNPFPIVVNPTNGTNSIFVQYLFPGVINEVENVNKCKYVCGLLDDDNNMVVQDTFIIIARKTNKFVGAYEERINFDSVYIGNQFQVSKKWFVRNVWTTPQRIFKDEYKLISSVITGTEITPQRLGSDIILAPDRDAIDWNFSYIPLDTKPDEAIYKMYFYPLESEGNTDKVDSIQTRITGTGVTQNLKIVSVPSGHFLSISDNKYSINLGNLRPGEKEIVSFVVQNDGNFPIGNKIENFSNNRDDVIKLLDGISSKKHLYQTQTDTIDIEFTAGSGGNISFKYHFESDLMERRISGAQRANSVFEVNFTGTVKQPIVLLNKDSLDFGSLTISTDVNCNSFISQTLQIKNIGNETLSIFNIIPKDGANYTVSYVKSELAPLDTSIITITYKPDIPGNHKSELLIITNAAIPYDTNYVELVGSGVPQADIILKIDSVRSFPGTEVLMPIIVEKEKITNANNYTDVLRYNRTLLQFVEPIFMNTASSASSLDTRFRLNQDGNLEVNIKRQSEENFLESDTLVILKFATFLGNAKYTSIDFTDSKFSNRNCDRLFEIKPQRGIYEIDSVCGLDFKLYDAEGVNVAYISPNPISTSSHITILTPVDMTLDLQVVNTLGEIEMNIMNTQLKQGSNEIEIDFSGLSNGVYNIMLVKDRIITNRTIIINR